MLGRNRKCPLSIDYSSEISVQLPRASRVFISVCGKLPHFTKNLNSRSFLKRGVTLMSFSSSAFHGLISSWVIDGSRTFRGVVNIYSALISFGSIESFLRLLLIVSKPTAFSNCVFWLFSCISYVLSDAQPDRRVTAPSYCYNISFSSASTSSILTLCCDGDRSSFSLSAA